MASNSNTSRGIGFAGALTILFIALKLIGAITWSWWWVLSPLLISAALGTVVVGLCMVFAGIAFLLAYLMED